jgi:hypothetical protein
MATGSRYIASARIAQKTPLQTVTHPLPSNGRFSGPTALTLRKYATVFEYRSNACNVHNLALMPPLLSQPLSSHKNLPNLMTLPDLIFKFVQ